MNENRLSLLSWLILPLLAVWLTTNYLVGLKNKPLPTVLSAQTEYVPAESKQTNNFTWQGSGLVTFWLDDAWYSQYQYVPSVLGEFSYKAALSVATDQVAGDSYMTWPQIQKLQIQGWEIVSHGVSHNCDPSYLTPENIKTEILKSKQVLTQKGLVVETFVTPCGIQNQEMLLYAKDNYVAMRTAGSGTNSLPVTDPYALTIQVLKNSTTIDEVRFWLAEARLNKSWLILTVHQIGHTGLDYEVTPELFTQIVKLVQSSELPVVLPKEALQI